MKITEAGRPLLAAIQTMNNLTGNKKELSLKQRKELLTALKARFEKNLNRHKGLEWARVQAKLEANVEKLWSLNEMERTGGEPDVVGQDHYCPGIKRGGRVKVQCLGASRASARV
jgi:hypothetical protein